MNYSVEKIDDTTLKVMVGTNLHILRGYHQIMEFANDANSLSSELIQFSKENLDALVKDATSTENKRKNFLQKLLGDP